MAKLRIREGSDLTIEFYHGNEPNPAATVTWPHITYPRGNTVEVITERHEDKGHVEHDRQNIDA